MTITQVSFVVQLDTNAIQGHLGLSQWVKALNIDTPEPTWDHVYRELGKILVGAPHYKNYCKTAMSDNKEFSIFKLYDRVETKTPAAPGFDTETPHPTPKVLTPPTPINGSKA